MALRQNQVSSSLQTLSHSLGQLQTFRSRRMLFAILMRPKESRSMLTGTCHCGKLDWTFDGMPDSATSCNCTLCRRYGVLWIYDYEGERIKISGLSVVYTRKDTTKPALEIHFCGSCGCIICWRGLQFDSDGRRRIAVNLRLTEPGPIAQLPIDHFDGLDKFEDLPRDGRCVADVWF